MSNNETNKELEKITDQGMFERLATEVLRVANFRYRLLSHTGVNKEGKTIKAPIDGITFLNEGETLRMFAVHHTTCKKVDLETKWLHDPSTVKPRKGKKPTAPPGDLIKTAQIYKEQLKETPDLKATLILTTNREPDESLVRKVHTEGQKYGLEVEFWSRSALAHILDYDPKGQWIRKKYLQIEQERLSEELLHELSSRSLENNKPFDDKTMWIDRELDETLNQLSSQKLTYISAESGQGKSISCYKHLMKNFVTGGFSLILSHEVISQAPSLNLAIDEELRNLHPLLAHGSGDEALALATESKPLIIVVEDINKSTQPAVLIERIAHWCIENDEKNSEPNESLRWKILCPVWSKILSSLNYEVHKHINPFIITASSFTSQEGTNAVMRRYESVGVSMTSLEAESISSALGHDPLLIALQNYETDPDPDPDSTIQEYIQHSLTKLAQDRAEFTPDEYVDSLRKLSRTMLECCLFDITFKEALQIIGNDTDSVKMLRHIAYSGQIFHISSSDLIDRIVFRHDRVRDWLLTDAVATLMRSGERVETILAEPYFTEIIGAALLRKDIPFELVEQTKILNPLAIFYAIRLIGEPGSDFQRGIISAAENWVDQDASHSYDYLHLRWFASRMLSECDSSYVIPIIKKFREDQNDWWALRARFRNGDIHAGVELCRRTEIGMQNDRDIELIQHVMMCRGNQILEELIQLLSSEELSSGERVGALRLAGHIGDNALSKSIEQAWLIDSERDEYLGVYFWAAAQCYGEESESFLNLVCESWTLLSNEVEEGQSISPRTKVAMDEIDWGFKKKIPEAALKYLIQRAKNPDLKNQIVAMLQKVDHPEAVEFIARQLAPISERSEESGDFYPFLMFVVDYWVRQYDDRATIMSSASSERLHSLWTDNELNKHLRKQAFLLWSSTIKEGDISILKTIPESDELWDLVLWQRLRRGDREAIPYLLEKLRGDKASYWWQAGRFIWSDELTQSLDEELIKRSSLVKQEWDYKWSHATDWITSERLMELETHKAEELIIKHWDHLRFSSCFVQAALYLGTSQLKELVAIAVSECPNPKSLFEHIISRFGYKTKSRKGIVHKYQVEVVLPYLDYFDDMDIYHLWEACNGNGWFELRRQYLDLRVNPDSRHRYIYIDDASATKELDDILKNNRVTWVYLWVDHFLETGVNIDHVMMVLDQWLERQTKIEALELAAEAVMRSGNRSHLKLLNKHKFKPKKQATSIIANASFALKQRSLI